MRRSGVLALTILLSAPAIAFAHIALRRSVPAEGATLQQVPGTIRLTFNQAPDARLTQIQLVAADSTQVALSAPRVAAPDSTRTIVADVEGALRPGAYRVLWRVTSADGHPVRGTIRFVIAEGAAGVATDQVPLAAQDSAVSAAHDEPDAGTASEFGVGSFAYATIRFATFLALLFLLGALAFALIVVPGTHHRVPDLDPSFAIGARERAARIARIAVFVLPLILLARVVAQSHAVTGRMPDGEFLKATLPTPWGAGIVLHAVAAALAIVAFHDTRKTRWRLALVSGLMLAISAGLWGHAAASGRWTFAALASDAIHVLAAGGWLGGLAVVLVAGIPAASVTLGGAAIRGMIHAFSPMALTFAGLLTATGVFAAVLRVGSWNALTSTDFGRLLILKVILLGIVLMAGAFNWLRVRPTLDATRVSTLRRSAFVELAFAVAILGVTAWLVATPPPASL